MDTNNIKHLYQQYLDRRLSPSELMELKQLLATKKNLTGFEELIDADWDNLDQLSSNFAEERKTKIFNNIIGKAHLTNYSSKFWKYASVAAAIIIITSTYFIIDKIRDDNRQALYASKIRPGKTGATLTLGNGRVISLSTTVNGALLKEAGITVTKTTSGAITYDASETIPTEVNGSSANQINKLETDKGETYLLTLPDKSKVWLNAKSSIYFPSKFSEKYRKVKLLGEAYFEITKDPQHPFLVESGSQTVEVLGTSFNINAYGDDGAIKTTLLEGKVKINIALENSTVLLPNQQAVYKGTSIEVSPADTEAAIDWKNGYFIFKNESFKSAMRKIERWYDVEMIYASDISIDLEPGGWISRTSDIKTILDRIEATSGIHFKMEGRRIRVSK